MNPSGRILAPIIYINGHPGVGKMTIAMELKKLMPTARLFNYHLIEDMTNAHRDGLASADENEFSDKLVRSLFLEERFLPLE